jgi:hypothetical protein
MLPRLVGGADESFALLRCTAEPQDQLPNVSPPLFAPLEYGGVAGREFEFEFTAGGKAYAERDSRSRWCSGGARLGEEGYWGGACGEYGDMPGCHPSARISAEVCLLIMPGGASTLDKGWGPGGGAGGKFRDGDDCVVLPPPMDP